MTRRKRSESPLDWKLIIPFAVGLFIFLRVIVPWLNMLVAQYTILPVYPLFLITSGAIVFLGGQLAHKGLDAMILFMLGFIASDIYIPPYHVTQLGELPVRADLLLASDVWFYLVYNTVFGFPVTVAWWLTYFVTPVVLIILFAYELKVKRLKKWLGQIQWIR